MNVLQRCAALWILGLLPLSAGTKLSEAALHNDIPRMQACLAAGENIDELDKWGWTPLMWAVYYRYAPATQFLLDHHANPNVPVAKGYRSIPKGGTPLTICGYFGLEEFTRMLLKAGADPSLTDEKGKKPLDYAREYRFEEVVRLMEGGKAGLEPKPAPPMPKPAPVPAAAPKPQPAPAAKPAPAAETRATPQAKPAPKKAVKKKPRSEPPAIK